MRRSKFVLAVLFCLLSASWSSYAQETIRTVEIGQLAVTHILFASDLTYVNVASPNVMRAKVVESSKNMLALQATSEFAFQTTLSALETNGTMHTFYVRYNSEPGVLLIDTRVPSGEAVSGSVNAQIRPEPVQVVDQPSPALVAVEQKASEESGGPKQRAKSQPAKRQKGSKGTPSSTGMPQQAGVNVTATETSNFGRGNAPSIEEVMRKERKLYHITDKCFGIEAQCINVFAYSDQLYIIFSLTNRSDIGYDAGDAQFAVETKKVSSNTLHSDKEIWAKSSFGKLACAPNSMTKIGYTIPKLTLQKNEVLRVYIYEKDGTRNLFLTLDAADVNYAVSPI